MFAAFVPAWSMCGVVTILSVAVVIDCGKIGHCGNCQIVHAWFGWFVDLVTQVRVPPQLDAGLDTGMCYNLVRLVQLAHVTLVILTLARDPGFTNPPQWLQSADVAEDSRLYVTAVT